MTDCFPSTTSPLRLNPTTSELSRLDRSRTHAPSKSATFYFPTPGHKAGSRSIASTLGTVRPAQAPKAQRVLGVDGLNVDVVESPQWDKQMSFSISEAADSPTSTMSLSENEGASSATELTLASGMLPKTCYDPSDSSAKSSRPRQLGHRQTSSASVDTSARQRQRPLPPRVTAAYYDRERAPKAISQQTSASSARDLALRKGSISIIPSRPVQLSPEPEDIPLKPTRPAPSPPKVPPKSLPLPPGALGAPSEPLRRPNLPALRINTDHAVSMGDALPTTRQKLPRKKPAKLDLSSLFSKTKRTTIEVRPRTPGTALASSRSNFFAPSADSKWRRLRGTQSKESMPPLPPPKPHERSGPLLGRSFSQTSSVDTIYSLYEKYERSHLDRVNLPPLPEPKVMTRPDKAARPAYTRSNSASQRKLVEPMLRLQPLPEESMPSAEEAATSSGASVFSWSEARLEKADKTSMTSVSSEDEAKPIATRHVRKASAPAGNLKHHSMLSLSSDSDSDDVAGPPVPPKERLPQGLPPQFQRTIEALLSTKSSPVAKPERPRIKQISSPKSARLILTDSPLRSRPSERERHCHGRCSHVSPRKQRRHSRKTSLYSLPRLDTDLPYDNGNGQRFMAVTEQEEALLAALRRKRAGMRDRLLDEHESYETYSHRPQGSVASIRDRRRFADALPVTPPRQKSSPKKTPGSSQQKERILMVLKTPISDVHPFDIAEPSPSPDLSDFLTFGSDDEEEVPAQSSWIIPGHDRGHGCERNHSHRGRSRPNFPPRKSERRAPLTPPSKTRSSAFGEADELVLSRERSVSSRMRYLDEIKSVQQETLLRPQSECQLEEGETFVIWRM